MATWKDPMTTTNEKRLILKVKFTNYISRWMTKRLCYVAWPWQSKLHVGIFLSNAYHLVSFTAVFRDVTQRSPEIKGSNHIPFPLCLKQPIKSMNCEWCNFRAKVMWDFRATEWNAEKSCGWNLKVFPVLLLQRRRLVTRHHSELSRVTHSEVGLGRFRFYVLVTSLRFVTHTKH